MSQTTVQLTHRRFPETARKDAWWVQPLVVFLILSGFLVYTGWAALQNAHYRFGPYLSPLYSPEFGRPGWWPSWFPFCPALLILPFPGLFRLTCYYYRGSYYKAFWADPPACTVGEPRKRYRGERWFPLILQNVHRYFMYIALIFLVILSYDVWKALWWPDSVTGGEHLGIGVGTLVLAANVVCLSGYTFGCHSLRHLAGGFRDQFSRKRAFAMPYACVSCFNRAHHRWAWVSLVMVAFADVYVRLCSMGIWHDLRIL
jgi:hypothetical protein